MTDAIKKYKAVPDRGEMIHNSMYAHIIKHSSLSPLDSLTSAMADWLFLGCKNGFCKIEWCNNHHFEYSRIEDPLWSGPNMVPFIAEDMSFFSPAGVQLTNMASVLIDDIGYIRLLHRRQKNNDNYQHITYGRCLSNQVLCPVRAMLRIFQLAIRLCLPLLQSVAISSCGATRSWQQITSKDVTEFLRSVAQSVFALPASSPQLKL